MLINILINVLRYPYFTPQLDPVVHSTSVLAPGTMKFVTSISNTFTLFSALQDLSARVIVSIC